MIENMNKYANLLLNTCLKVDKDKPLFISVNIERIDFARIVVNNALKLGIKDIYMDIVDPYIKHDALLNLSLEELKKNQYFDRSIWNTYAKNGAAFLMLASEMPGLMNDVDPKKLNDITTYMHETRKEFDELREKGLVPWCIAAVPTLLWAKEVFNNSSNPVEDLWNKIFEICYVTDNNPEEKLNKKLERLENNARLLNEYNFKSLRYINSLGTNFTIGLPENHIWATGYSNINGKKILVNFPTEEVFTSPDRRTANGIVYNAKPLCYQDNLIDDFNITFKDGKVVEVHAKKGEDVLKELISSTPNMDALGEVAIVEKTSSINITNLIYYETLFDENAACHLALGDSFPECLKNGEKTPKKELYELGLNDSLNHVDFMIGTNDLNIIGITFDNKEIPILKDGIYVLK